ncbi:MAG: T9SS C-terminal target domain-containing protein, partial [Flavobacteriia bacterium]|nr:T9SS C-terminal target domain-containing protein [Flavobacteriia bacterium]
ASGLNELNPENVSLYPNPSNDQITLEFENLDVQAIQLFDIMGKEMLYLVGNSAPKMEVSLAGISKGLYHVKIQTKQGIVTKTLLRN